MSTALNAASLPLQGRHLIEASAGTGKTFTVANLYLRLLIDDEQYKNEQSKPPLVEEILVVTFTNAATEELRARLRSRITVALQVLDGESPADADATLHEVLEPHSGKSDTRARLELACQCMDQAAIFTIHGFCDRVLREQAFESGELFDAELQADVEALKLQAAQAWWRENITPLSAADTELIPKAWRSPAAILNRLTPVLTDPSGKLIPQFTEEQMQKTQRDYEAAWQRLVAGWASAGETWSEQVLAGVQNKLITKTTGSNTYTPEAVSEACDYIESIVIQEATPESIHQRISLLGNRSIQESTKKNKEPLQASVGDQIDSLLTTYNELKLQRLVALQLNAQQVIGLELTQQKLLSRQRTFDDLLLQLHSVLYGDNGDRLTSLLRARYPVALIDEFQDTDRIQFEIFDKLFPMNADSSSALYLIGDPKQSIYGFRGADVNMYLRAGETTDNRHALDNNWRSSERLINALNRLYSQSDKPFGSTGIHYQSVTAGGRAEGRALSVKGEVLAPLQFDYVDVGTVKLPNMPVTVAALATRCAQRVVWLLTEGNARLGSVPVQAKDISILVRTHPQAQAARQALLALGVASATQSRESVFLSPEALDVLALLRVLAKPGDSRSLSRVLVSPLGGYSATELLQQREDAVAWQTVEDAVQRCREQCRQSGPQAAILCFMALFDSRVKSLGTVASKVRGVDRILGNYLHLADVLQVAWQDQPELPALIKAAQRWREQSTDESLQLRLESDESLVQIVTVHKSKGLQYPVVMLPFVGIGGYQERGKRDAVAFTDNGQPRMDVGSEQLEQRLNEADQSDEDESLRTLYVALTRAEQSCWVGVSANKHAHRAALWKLLGLSLGSGQKTEDSQPLIQDALARLVDSCKDIAISESLAAQKPLSVVRGDHHTLQARAAKRYVKSSWRVGSYTAIARGATHTNEQAAHEQTANEQTVSEQIASEEPDYDAVDVPVNRPETVDYNSPYHFPRGADPGTLVHAVFEHLDFVNSDNQYLHSHAEKQLRAHGIDSQWAPALCQLVRNTLDTPLIENGFALAGLDRKDRLDEMEFHFPVESLQADKLVTLLRDYQVIGAEDDLVFDRLDGYMKGFIDLTFRYEDRWYIADYKSNHLGYESADYGAEALEAAMQHHRYDLQYLIYAVALRRYLGTRLPDFDSARDFGGVFYLFVRGMSGKNDNGNLTGVYAARPPEKLLQALDKLLVKDTDNA